MEPSTAPAREPRYAIGMFGSRPPKPPKEPHYDVAAFRAKVEALIALLPERGPAPKPVHVPGRIMAAHEPAAPGLRTIVVSGAADGPDAWGVEAARARGLDVFEKPAKWRDAEGRYNKAAGVQRTASLIPHLSVAVIFYDGISDGSAHTIGLARDAGLPTYVFYPGDTTPPEAHNLEPEPSVFTWFFQAERARHFMAYHRPGTAWLTAYAIRHDPIRLPLIEELAAVERRRFPDGVPTYSFMPDGLGAAGGATAAPLQLPIPEPPVAVPASTPTARPVWQGWSPELSPTNVEDSLDALPLFAEVRP